jgi:hypothetical protein
VAHRKRSAAARIAVELRQHDSGERQRRAECARDVHRVLALHRIDDEQRLRRLQHALELGDLAHHLLVDREAPGGIDDQHLVVAQSRVLVRRARDVGRILAGVRREKVHAGLRRDGFQLLDRRRAIDVARDDEHFFPLLVLQHARELADRRRLARSLQARHQDHRRRLHREVQRRVRFAHQARELAVHEADERLSGRKAADDVLAERLFPDRGDEILDDGSATSASSNATRTSRSASWMFASVRRASPRICLTIFARRAVRLSSMGDKLKRCPTL